MKTTRYFEEQVRRKRPYIDPAWCTAVIAPPCVAKYNPTAVFASGVRPCAPAKTRPASFAW